ncbi:MAG: UPF0147 family protein [Candidatus Thermoplasmatota archaeon]|jgi:uncharacterized protein (UPF0147 family)|nr:UPF0147 family protein [Candidatus Thermoplasmatota archaeon]MCL5963382.1 UPF0147 family protein [Candidatus Thermoplasmatota archaeon]
MTNKEGKIKQILDSLDQLSNDSTIPKNIRKGAQVAKDTLNDANKPLDVRIATITMILDELANDSNIPIHGRTAVWNIISQIEFINK